ncbi:MlaD family protein [Fibrobacter sp.]|jgi:phospholipid/cholesterol/gamma-HCH transport system substrate-binding protein|uniref:MlaD family protein n=1 Tax=Fibrobacter sp. TaxID=35828 RepID=UPI0025C11089|nr:MlaD family protein [Fibrobacter sp.]MBR3070802.1 MCE family protein [Fibrobacter sp.]
MNSLLIKIKQNILAIFVFLVIVVSCGLAAYFYHPASPYHKRYTFVVKYETIGTLSPGNFVRVRGIVKGEIMDVKLTEDAVYVTARVLADAKIPVNSEFRLVTAGLMGEREMSVITGNSSKLVAEGDTVSGLYDEGTSGISKNLAIVFKDLEEIKLISVAFIDTMTNGEIGQRVGRVTDKAGKILRVAKADILKWKSLVNGLLDDCHEITGKLESSLQEISDRGGEAAAKANELLDRVHGVVDRVNALKEKSVALIQSIDEREGTVTTFKTQFTQINEEVDLLKKNFDALIAGVKSSGLKLNVDIF